MRGPRARPEAGTRVCAPNSYLPERVCASAMRLRVLTRPRRRTPSRRADQAGAAAGSGRTTTVSATAMISSAARSAREACSRIASGLLAW
jgi:hypothetical protein